jgi:hypothetical protein
MQGAGGVAVAAMDSGPNQHATPGNSEVAGMLHVRLLPPLLLAGDAIDALWRIPPICFRFALFVRSAAGQCLDFVEIVRDKVL